MCCFCCPTAISALFCLYVQSGCNKGTVAGALTFFPPEPALYEFERLDKSGTVLAPGQEAGGDSITDPTHTTAAAAEAAAVQPECNAQMGPLQVPETRGQTKEQIQSPIQQLTDQAKERRLRASARNALDTADRGAGVTYQLLLDPRLQVPPHDDASIQALKIPHTTTTSFRHAHKQHHHRRNFPSHVAAVLYSVQRRTPTTKTIIYSHGNATDLGAMFPLQVVISHSLDVNVLVYDYSGYGESGGVPDEAATYKDIDAVYDYVWEHVAGCNAGNIVLYGQSVGSGPCCYLAAKLAKEAETNNSNDDHNNNNCSLGGMILHSPFTSGMRVLTPSRILACLDIYPNIDRIKKVTCPVLVIHGILDQEVDVSHGQEMHRSVPEQYQRTPWWVPDRGHNDVTEGPGKLAEYVRRLRTFLTSLDD
jgi:abhydrolase domain-containing protein 17